MSRADVRVLREGRCEAIDVPGVRDGTVTIDYDDENRAVLDVELRGADQGPRAGTRVHLPMSEDMGDVVSESADWGLVESEIASMAHGELLGHYDRAEWDEEPTKKRLLADEIVSRLSKSRKSD